MKTKIYLILLVLMTKTLVAQQYVDILKLNVNTSPYNTFKNSTSKSMLNEMSADLSIPVKINERFTFLSGFIYEDINTKLFEDGELKNFGALTLKVGMNKQLNDKWSTTLVLLPKLSSDFGPLQSKDFQLGAISIWKLKKSDHLNYKFGMYYNSELFGPFFVPMIGLYYLSDNKKFETNLMLPLQADVNYKVLPFMQAGANFNGQIRSYNLNNVTNEYASTYLVRSTTELYVYLKFNCTKNVSLYTKVGRSFGRSYKVYNSNDKVDMALPMTFLGHHRNQLNTDFSDGLIFQVSLLYRIHLK